MAVHAIGDAANRMVLDVFESSGGSCPYPYRIEHAQHLDPEDLPRFARGGFIASVQPIHLSFDLDQIVRTLGERASGSYRIRSLLDSGARVIFGSDAPVADPNPWLGISAAVNRTRPDNTPAGGWFPGEKITLAEAIAAYTRLPAEAGGDAFDGGCIKRGMKADLCVLDRDPFAADPADLGSVGVEMTVFNGRIAYRSASTAIPDAPTAMQ